MDRAEARRQGHGPVVRRHDDRPDRDDGGGHARRRRSPCCATRHGCGACPGRSADPVVACTPTMRPPGRAADDAALGSPPLEVRFVGHATVLLEVGGPRVLTDPFLRASARAAGAARPAARSGATWASSTSCSSRTATRTTSTGHRWPPCDGAPTVVVPRGSGATARRAARGEVMEVAAGRTARGRVASRSRPCRPPLDLARRAAGTAARLRPGRSGRASTSPATPARFAGLARARGRRRRRAAAGLDVGPAPRARASRPAVGGRGARRHPARRSRSRSTGGRSIRDGCTASGAGR